MPDDIFHLPPILVTQSLKRGTFPSQKPSKWRMPIQYARRRHRLQSELYLYHQIRYTGLFILQKDDNFMLRESTPKMI